MRRFVHTLSFPEHLWLDFARSFFSQNTLLIDDTGAPIVNNFKYSWAEDDANKRFDILLENDLKTNNPHILPSIVIEDMGVASLGVAINRLATWAVSPQTDKTRSDLLRTTYVFHCCSRARGESRLLASIFANAITVFYDQLLRAGFHKLEPWSIGKTVPVKSDSDEVYVDTPVQVTFEYQQTWRTIEDGPQTVSRYRLVIAQDHRQRYVRVVMDLADPSATGYVAMSMTLADPGASIYVNTALDLVEPGAEEGYVLAALDLEDPESEAAYVRTSMRVS